MSIKENISNIRKSVSQEIRIVAATKTRKSEEIKEAIDAGIMTIGENYVQEAEARKKLLKKEIEIHCIGHLQKNKVKKAVEIFDIIQTVDSEKLADEIDKRSRNINKIIPILIEVNIAKEDNKDGCMPENVEKLAEYISKLKNVRLKGLMTMGPNTQPEKLRPYFKEAKKLFDKLKDNYPDIDTLSMGMSDSYNIALEEGSNMIRLGTAIFGKR